MPGRPEGQPRQIKPSLYQSKTLFDRIREIWLKGDPPQDVPVMLEIVEYLERTLDILEFFHDNDLVMHDVKPANFGFFDDRLVVVDFGSITCLGEPPHEIYRRIRSPRRPIRHPPKLPTGLSRSWEKPSMEYLPEICGRTPS